MYPNVIMLKQMFADFFPKFKQSVVRNDNAWQIVDSQHMYWADDAVKLKRTGDYIGACQLYFNQILNRKAITLGWAAGIFKTLAAAGDIGDAVDFGIEWYGRYASGDLESDTVIQHLNNVLALLVGQANMSFPAYLQQISGNPAYTIDMNQTDLYSSQTLRDLKVRLENH